MFYMKKMLLFAILALTSVSCKWTGPNDRAIFNLQGPVHLLTEYAPSGEETACLVFDRSGNLNLSESDYPVDITNIQRGYGELTAVVNGVPTTYSFDGDGRMKESVAELDNAKSTLTYKYKGDSPLPVKITMKGVTADGQKMNQVSEPTYSSVDSYGNWTAMTSDGVTLTREISYYEDMANVANCPMDRSINFEAIFGFLLGLAYLAAIGAALWHMIKENYLTKYRTDYTPAEFSQQRVAQGLPAEMSAEENQLSRDLLDEVYDAWTTTNLPDGTEIFCPMTRQAVLLTKKNMATVIAMNPTDEAVVERINAFNSTLGNAFEREFNGSKPLLVVAGIFAVINFFVVPPSILFVGLGIAFYWLASRPPLFMVVRKELKGTNTSKSIISSIIAGTLAMVAGAKTYKVVTKWSDGTTTTDTDDTETWVSLIIMLIVMVVLASFILIFGLINYIRNYHLYR